MKTGRKDGVKNALKSYYKLVKTSHSQHPNKTVLSSMSTNYDIIIIGAGLVGMSTALACAYKGAKIAIIDAVHPDEKRQDGRASAIAASSFQMFKTLDVIQSLEAEFQPVQDMLISDGSVNDVSPLMLHFDSREVNGPTGYMVENDVLRRALFSAVKAQTGIEFFAPVELVETQLDPAFVQVSLSNGVEITGSLIVAADGRRSTQRKSAGIGVFRHRYNQKALVTTFCHEFPHDGVAHQIFFSGGPLALLPLTENRMSIVWTDRASAIEAAMNLPEKAFIAELRRRSGNFLGEMFLCADRQMFPLSLQMAETYTSNRLALVGDAAHAIHPLAGQGLNMGLRDAAALADVIVKSKSLGLDIGTDLKDYNVWRNFDTQVLAASTDILNRVFSNRVSPIRHMRRLGLAAINQTSVAKSFFMKEASGKSGNLPSLLRG